MPYYTACRPRPWLTGTVVLLVAVTTGCASHWWNGSNELAATSLPDPSAEVESTEESETSTGETPSRETSSSRPESTETADTTQQSDAQAAVAPLELSEILADYRKDVEKLPPAERRRVMQAMMAIAAAAASEKKPDSTNALRASDDTASAPPSSAASTKTTTATENKPTEPRASSPPASSRSAVHPTRQPAQAASISQADSSRPPQLARGDREQTRAIPSNPPASSPVQNSSGDETNVQAKTASDVDWLTSVERAITDLQKQLNTPKDEQELSTTELGRREVLLKMLQVVAGDAESAFEKFQYVDGREAAFWRAELFGLHLGVQENRTPVVSQRAARMLEHLRKATWELAAVSTLDLRNAAFCRSVLGYADVEKFRPYRFKPDEEVLLYVEIENFAAERIAVAGERGVGSGEGVRYETEFQGSYQILDGERRRVAEQQLPRDRQQCRNHRRDYYVAYRIYMPRNIAPGRYTLELTLEDVKGQKFGQAFLDFEITR